MHASVQQSCRAGDGHLACKPQPYDRRPMSLDGCRVLSCVTFIPSDTAQCVRARAFARLPSVKLLNANGEREGEKKKAAIHHTAATAGAGKQRETAAMTAVKTAS